MLTKSGLGALVAGVLMIAGGMVWRYLELSTLGACIVGLTVVSVIAVRARQPARIERVIPNRRTARGTPLRIDYRVLNETRRRSPPLTIVDQLGGRTTNTLVPSLPKRDRIAIPNALPADRRGIFDVGPAFVERSDPFWFAVGRRQEIGTAVAIVHPIVYEIEGPFGSFHSVSEEAVTRSFSVDPLSGFVSMREYVDGDDPRLIHWPTTARTGTLMVREHVELRRPEFAVIVDAASWVANPDDFEQIVDVAASLGVHALRSGIHVRVGTTNLSSLGYNVPFQRDTEVLDFLTPIQQTGGDQNVELSRIVQLGGSAGLIAFITGPNGPSSQHTHLDNVEVIRIGQGAERGTGINAVATTAAQFAQGWR